MEKLTSLVSQIYCSGDLYSGGDAVIENLKSSGFTSVVAWAMHVTKEGNLVFNDTDIVTDGRYVGNPVWPNQLMGLKTGATSVNRLIFSIGGWGVGDFPNIKALIDKFGIGEKNPLFQNLKVLFQLIPEIDAIDLDDESLYDQNTIVKFSLMVKSLGKKITFCPFTNMGFWNDCLYTLYQDSPRLVEAYNLQCYAGGSGNNPGTWIDSIKAKMGPNFDAKGFVYPGLWCRHGTNCSEGECPSTISARLKNWNSTINGLQGGFIWMYDDIQTCKNSNVCETDMNTRAYALSILDGLKPTS